MKVPIGGYSKGKGNCGAVEPAFIVFREFQHCPRKIQLTNSNMYVTLCNVYITLPSRASVACCPM